MGLQEGPRHARAGTCTKADMSRNEAIQRTMGKIWGHRGECDGIVSRSKTQEVGRASPLITGPRRTL